MDTELPHRASSAKRDQTEMDEIQYDQEQTMPEDVITMSSGIKGNHPSSRDLLSPELARGFRTVTKILAGATQLHSSSDQTQMSIDDDSAST
jgi:hypothetical protein